MPRFRKLQGRQEPGRRCCYDTAVPEAVVLWVISSANCNFVKALNSGEKVSFLHSRNFLESKGARLKQRAKGLPHQSFLQRGVSVIALRLH
jgi:hypothetical protein